MKWDGIPWNSKEFIILSNFKAGEGAIRLRQNPVSKNSMHTSSSIDFFHFIEIQFVNWIDNIDTSLSSPYALRLDRFAVDERMRCWRYASGWTDNSNQIHARIFCYKHIDTFPDAKIQSNQWSKFTRLIFLRHSIYYALLMSAKGTELVVTIS